MLKPIVNKFRSDHSVRLKDIVEKQVPAKLKPIVVQRVTAAHHSASLEPPLFVRFMAIREWYEAWRVSVLLPSLPPPSLTPRRHQV